MTTPQLVIGNKNYSSWSLRAWLACKHSRLAFDEIRIALSTDQSKTELLKHSAAGKVPVYKDSNSIIWDSLAICEFLAETNPNLWPKGPYDRAWARSVSAEMHAGFSALREAMPMNCRARDRRVEISANVAKDIERILGIWRQCRDANRGKGPWLFGSFSIADTMYAPVVFRFRTYQVEVDNTVLGYMETLLNDEHILDWERQAEAESEVIETEEVGV